MKKTAFYEKHLELGAKMVPFAGYEMPVSYSGIKEEHVNVRSNVGVFDVSHMGQFVLKGDGAMALIQKLTSNNVADLAIKDVQYSCLMNERGGIVDDLLVYHLQENGYMLVVNASNIEKDWNWISAHNSGGVEMHNISGRTSMLAIQGPNALAVLESLTDMNLATMPYYTFDKGVFAGCKNVLVSATGYTGAGGFEVYVDDQNAGTIWDAVWESGQKHGMLPTGLGARDTLRLEKGFCLYGNDINDDTSPLEAGLGWITKLKTTDFISKNILLEQKKMGLARRLVGFKLVDKGIPRKDYSILDMEGNEIGVVTSGTKSPSLEESIGMGYVSKAHAKVGTEIQIAIRKKTAKAVIVKRPFL